MTSTKLILAAALLAMGGLVAHEPKVTEVLSKDLTGIPDKEGLMLTVEYPPGGSDPIHRYNAHAFVYVLEGNEADRLASRLLANRHTIRVLLTRL